MYRIKKNYSKEKFTALSILLVSIFSVCFIYLGNFWVPPDYYKDGTADTKLEAFARYGGDWIQYSQKEDGSFYYIYYPLRDVYSTQNNILRHEGTVLSLLWLYEYTEEPKYLYVAYKGIGFFLRFLGKIDDNTYYIKFNNKVKLGGAALAILCLTKYKELTESDVYDDIAKKLGNFIIKMQKKAGWFKSIYYYDGIYNYNWNSSIYPGEAMYALINLYKTYEKDKYLSALEKAFSFYSNSALYQWRNSAFIPWTTSALVDAYIETEESKYADFVFDMTDYQLNWQITTDLEDDEGNNLRGGFGTDPTVSSASYLEGIGDAYHLAKLLNNPTKIEHYEESLIYGVEFLMQLQYRHEKIKNLKHPHAAFGGFHLAFEGKEASDIRVDYTQHSISVIIRVLKYFDSKTLKNITISS